MNKRIECTVAVRRPNEHQTVHTMDSTESRNEEKRPEKSWQHYIIDLDTDSTDSLSRIMTHRLEQRSL